MNWIWCIFLIHSKHSFWWYVFCGLLFGECMRIYFARFKKVWCRKKHFTEKSIALKNDNIRKFHFWSIFVFVNFNRFYQFVEFCNPVFNIAFDSPVIQNPSSMNLLNRIGHVIFGFFFQFFSSFAKYKLAKMGATFVPIIMPNICWKYSWWNTCVFY